MLDLNDLIQEKGKHGVPSNADAEDLVLKVSKTSTIIQFKGKVNGCNLLYDCGLSLRPNRLVVWSGAA